MLTAQVESLFDGLKELKPLLEGHYDELSEHAKRGFELNPCYDVYLGAEFNGRAFYVTLREDGKLVGYFVGHINPCFHYQVLTVTLDIIYVVPEVRGKKGGQILMTAIDAEVKRRGVKLWKMGLKEAHREHMEKLLLGFGFEPFERTYTLWVED